MPSLLDGRLKVRHLVLVITIADQGTIQRAADQLRVTQPVVTRGLQELESLLGARVFERGRRGVTLTPVGQVFLDHARTIVAQLESAAEHVHALASGEAGTVVIGTHLAGSNRLLPEAVGAFKRSHLRAGVVIREGTPDLLATGLLSGSVDLVVGRLAPAARDARIVQTPLYREPIRVVVSHGHPATALANPSLSDLHVFPWILPVAQTQLRGELEAVFESAGVPLPLQSIECTSLLTLRSLVVSSHYVGVLPELIARDDADLVLLSTALSGVSRTVGVSQRRDVPLTPVQSEFFDQLAEIGRSIRGSLPG